VYISRELAHSGEDSRVRDARTHEHNPTASERLKDAPIKKRRTVAVFHRGDRSSQAISLVEP
jgi:hypothetical protein